MKVRATGNRIWQFWWAPETARRRAWKRPRPRGQNLAPPWRLTDHRNASLARRVQPRVVPVNNWREIISGQIVVDVVRPVLAGKLHHHHNCFVTAPRSFTMHGVQLAGGLVEHFACDVGDSTHNARDFRDGFGSYRRLLRDQRFS